MTKELAKTLTTALVQFIDSERPEGSMCCSDTECAGIEKMFEGDKFDIIETFIHKKLSRLTEWEKEVRHFSDACARRPNYVPSDGDIRNWAAELLALAKKELCNGCNANLEGYIKGQQDAKRQYDESVAYHFPTMPTTPVFGCDGIHCTNPHMDCINCPRKITGGFNTTCGTSTGNTSATDGKEHNPSFTD